MSIQTDYTNRDNIWNYINRMNRFDLLCEDIQYNLIFGNVKDGVYEFILLNIRKGYNKVEVVIDIRGHGEIYD